MMRQPWDSSSRRVWPVHCSPNAPSCQCSIEGGGDMRMITKIAKTIPVTSPAVHHKLFHMAAATWTPMTKGAATAAMTRTGPRLRRRQARVKSSYFFAAPSPAFLVLRRCNMPTSTPPTRAPRGRNAQFCLEHAARSVRLELSPHGVRGQNPCGQGLGRSGRPGMFGPYRCARL